MAAVAGATAGGGMGAVAAAAGAATSQVAEDVGRYQTDNLARTWWDTTRAMPGAVLRDIGEFCRPGVEAVGQWWDGVTQWGQDRVNDVSDFFAGAGRVVETGWKNFTGAVSTAYDEGVKDNRAKRGYELDVPADKDPGKGADYDYGG